jgi:hypothetical protein
MRWGWDKVQQQIVKSSVVGDYISLKKQYNQGFQLLAQGIAGLVSGQLNIKSRLIRAFQYSFCEIKASELPPELWQRLELLNSQVTRGLDPGKGSIAPSINNMSVDHVSAIASEVFEIFLELVSSF